VLGAEYCHQVDAAGLMHHVDLVGEVADHRGRVGHQADLLALQLLIAAGVEYVEAGLHAAGLTPAGRRGRGPAQCGERHRGSGGRDPAEYSSSCRRH
jgi:hypothetical protein